MYVTKPNLLVAGLAVACWAASGGAAVGQSQATTTGALHILSEAITNARTTGARLMGTQPRVVPGNAQYQDGLAKLQAGQYADAVTALQNAVRLKGDHPVYHGDLAGALAGAERWDEAALEFVRARQIQPGNQWYTVALAAVKALRQQWAEASINTDAAVAADSSIIDSTLAEAAVSWAWRSRRLSQVTAWANLVTERWPGTPEPWLRLANIYQQQGDTTRGVAAIRRYVALRPTDRTGLFLYSVFLYNAARYDSAFVLAREAVQDSVLRERAGEVLFGVGARTLADTSATDRTEMMVQALTLAKANANQELRQRIALFLGYALLRRVQAVDGLAERDRACEPAQQLDTLVGQALVNLQEGAALDSARVTPIIERTIPQYRQRSAAMVSQYCRNRR